MSMRSSQFVAKAVRTKRAAWPLFFGKMSSENRQVLRRPLCRNMSLAICHNRLVDVDDHPVTFAESLMALERSLHEKVDGEKFDQDLTIVLDQLMLSSKKPPSTLDGLIEAFCEGYRALAEDKKSDILVYVAEKYNVDFDEVKKRAKAVGEAEDRDQLARIEIHLRKALEPPYNWLFYKTALARPDGVKFLADFRTDIANLLASAGNDLRPDQRLALKTMSGHLKELLSHWFSSGQLDLEQVTWDSPCSMLQKISDYEAVHPMRNWTDLKARVGPYRRCFVYTHRAMPGEPIVVLHVALLQDIASDISSLIKHQRQVKKAISVDVDDMTPNFKGSAGSEDPALCTTAIFYSITSTQTGLKGIELGNSLIKQAVKKLRAEFPSMGQFSTLSPVPGFKSWLMTTLARARKASEDETSAISRVLSGEELARISGSFYGRSDDPHGSLVMALKTNQWAHNEDLRAALELPLMRLCARYLFSEKHRSCALDPVANFHIRNGATMWRINWLADMSARGLNNSCGIMVNYRYFLDAVDANSENYIENKTIDASEQVKRLALQASQIA